MNILIVHDEPQAASADALRRALATAGHTLLLHDPMGLPRKARESEERATELVQAVLEADLLIGLLPPAGHGRSSVDMAVGLAFGGSGEVVLWDESAPTTTRMHPSPISWMPQVWRGSGPLTGEVLAILVSLVELMQLKQAVDTGSVPQPSAWHAVADGFIAQALGFAWAWQQEEARSAALVTEIGKLKAAELQAVVKAQADAFDPHPLLAKIDRLARAHGFFNPDASADITTIVDALCHGVELMAAAHKARSGDFDARLKLSAEVDDFKKRHGVDFYGEGLADETIQLLRWLDARVQFLGGQVEEQAQVVANAGPVLECDPVTLETLRQMMAIAQGDGNLPLHAAIGAAVTVLRDLRGELLRLEEEGKHAQAVVDDYKQVRDRAEGAIAQHALDAAAALDALEALAVDVADPNATVTAARAVREAKAIVARHLGDLALAAKVPATGASLEVDADTVKVVQRAEGGT